MAGFGTRLLHFVIQCWFFFGINLASSFRIGRESKVGWSVGPLVVRSLGIVSYPICWRIAAWFLVDVVVSRRQACVCQKCPKTRQLNGQKQPRKTIA